MPWNDNSNPGPWGSPPSGDGDGEPKPPPRNRGPVGPRRPGGGAPPPLDFDPFLNRLRGVFGGGPGGGMRSGVAGGLLAGAVVLWGVSGLYVVQPNEQGVVTTFGAYARTEDPGLRYHLPFPIEKVEKVAVSDLKRLDVGGSTPGDTPEESLMLTGDENIADVTFSVVWRIGDARAFLFNVRDPEKAVKAVAESAMREAVGKTDLQSILTSGRGAVQLKVADLMQATLDRWRLGVTVVEVQIRSANPPAQVMDASREVINATQEKESKVNEANAYRNRVVNEAKGDASRIVQAAEAYKVQAVQEAMGEAARFDQVLAEYRRAPGVTRQRLYVETMQRVLARSNKIIVDAKGASAPIILPPDAFRPRGAPPTTRGATTDSGGVQTGDQAAPGAAR